jgi:hypothetical protein
MNAKHIALGIGSTVVLGAAGAGIAGATSSNGSGPPAGGPPGGAAIASYLGVSTTELQTDLKNGQTLAAIAAAQGKNVAGLEAAMLADAKTHLDADVTAGTLTAAQEQAMLANLQSHIDEIVNSTGPIGGKGGRGGPGGPASAAVATYLGITQAELQAERQKGQTLAAIATAHGRTVAGLEAAVLADAKAHLDGAVSDGKLSAAQEQTMLADLQSRVSDIVNSTGPPAGGPHGGPGRPPAAATTTQSVRF